MTKLTTRVALGGFAAALLISLPTSSAHAANCKLTKNEEYNRSAKGAPTYTRSLKVSGGAKCATGHKMIRAFYSCRVAPPSRGLAGRCTKKVLGYSCSERRFNKVKHSFDASVTCKKGRARIRTDYTQFTSDPRKG